LTNPCNQAYNTIKEGEGMGITKDEWAIVEDIYLKELESCIMTKTKHDSFSGESWDESCLNIPKAMIIMRRYVQSFIDNKTQNSEQENSNIYGKINIWRDCIGNVILQIDKERAVLTKTETNVFIEKLQNKIGIDPNKESK
jgi:hypothetical protein